MENKSSKYIFIILAVLCVMMIVLSTVRDGLMNPIRNTVGSVLVPVQTGVNRVGLRIYEELRDRKSLRDAEEENRRLRERIDLLTEENNILKQNEQELSRLRELYQLCLLYTSDAADD